MKTLCMDSAHKHLVIALIEDGQIKAAFEKECWKRQSETLFPELMNCFQNAGWSVDDVNEVVISDGPGSYTGVRIAMSVAKVLCTSKNIPLSCISTLQLYAGLSEHTYVLLDARSKRAYFAHYHLGKAIGDEIVTTLDDITHRISAAPYRVVGDVDLLHQEKKSVSLAENFCDLLPYARKIDNIHSLTPRYLKDNDAYKVK
ncbi:MAG: tRNA (adenosine(37)-N6)-threonylcarbamoyltransferase complex dimerization subunit type 1 TsaB [Erysipelotrichaceae bacterium]|nr:tRNA (adenosine(37)-N6)-threonylcarbamoyltransferase complex dimerization subunit type 1 TsaB [Erysipelotrichaceae bacterium]